MDELRAALAIARKDIRNVSRYRFLVASQLFTPLYQGVLPALLFGASFAVAGHVVGLEKTIGTTDLAGFIFLGGVMSGLVATAFWSIAMSIRNEMEAGTLEPTWLTPTSRAVIVLGRAVCSGSPSARSPSSASGSRSSACASGRRSSSPYPPSRSPSWP